MFMSPANVLLLRNSDIKGNEYPYVYSYYVTWNKFKES